MKKMLDSDFSSFFNSDMDEAELYGFDKNNLIQFKDYLLDLQEKRKKFDNLADESISIIKDKFDWVKKIVPNLRDGVIDDSIVV